MSSEKKKDKTGNQIWVGKRFIIILNEPEMNLSFKFCEVNYKQTVGIIAQIFRKALKQDTKKSIDML